MNEVKEICAAVLNAPAPPMREVDEVLTAARRSARRRTWAAGAGTGMAVAAAAVMALLVPALAGAGPAPVATAGSPGRPTHAPPKAPTWRQAQAQAPRIVQILTAAVPAGYTVPSEWDVVTNWPSSADSRTAKPTPGRTRPGSGLTPARPSAPEDAKYSSVIPLLISAGGRQGELVSAFNVDWRPAPTGDLCSAAVSARLSGLVDDPAVPDTNCQVVMVAGVPVRVSTEHDATRGDVMIATRSLDGGWLTITAQEGVPAYHPDGQVQAFKYGGQTVSEPPHHPPLTRPIFTVAQIAAIAGNPGLLP
ncbi:MAG: hypothetical protein J2P15_07540 [Micromonosporaceae bacterium]|nr:hypothetical protein [Micromonosporaceae bacterium]